MGHSMPATTTCPKCGKKYPDLDNSIGIRFNCFKCGTSFEVREQDDDVDWSDYSDIRDMPDIDELPEELSSELRAVMPGADENSKFKVIDGELYLVPGADDNHNVGRITFGLNLVGAGYLVMGMAMVPTILMKQLEELVDIENFFLLVYGILTCLFLSIGSVVLGHILCYLGVAKPSVAHRSIRTCGVLLILAIPLRAYGKMADVYYMQMIGSIGVAYGFEYFLQFLSNLATFANQFDLAKKVEKFSNLYHYGFLFFIIGTFAFVGLLRDPKFFTIFLIGLGVMIMAMMSRFFYLIFKVRMALENEYLR